MGNFRKSLLVALAIAAGSATGVKAADFRFPPEPVVPVPAAIPVPEYSNWYLRGDIGVAFHENPDLSLPGATFTGEDMDETLSIGLGFGHYFTDKIRGDVTVDYYMSAEATGFDTVAGSTHTAELSSTAVLANLYFDFRGRDGFTPYLGAGIGFASNQTNGQIVTTAGVVTGGSGGAEKFSLAGAVMAGFSYRMHDSWLFDAGYRFLYMGDAETNANGATSILFIDDIIAHELRVGFRYELN